MRSSTRRSATIVLFGLLLPLLSPGTAHAAPAPADVLVVDLVGNDLNAYPFAQNATYDGSGTNVPVAGPSTILGGVRITRPTGASSGPGIEVLPADGTQLAVGHYSYVTGQWTSGARPLPVVRLIGAIGDCSAFAYGAQTSYSSYTGGWLDVSSVTYDGSGVVTSFAATYSMHCYYSSSIATGALRYHSDEPYTSATSSATYLGNVVTGSHTPVTATVTNRGTDPLTLGAPVATPHSTYANSLQLGQDGENCSQAPLASGSSCTVHLDYVADGADGGGTVTEMRMAAPSLIRGYVSLIVRASSVVFPPLAPTSATGDEAYDGVRVRWFRNSTGPSPDGYRIRRVDGPSPVLVATVDGIASDQWVDTSLAKGETATYQVSTYNAAGEAAAAPVTLTRPDLPDPPAAVDRRVLVVEDSTAEKVTDSTLGGTVTSQPLFATELMLTAPAGRIDLFRLPHEPGTYPVGPDTGQIHVPDVFSPGYGCSGLTGTVDVHESWIKADFTPYRVSADFHLMCAATIPIEVQVRIGTDDGYAALLTTGTTTDFQATVGQAPDVRSVAVSNPGGQPISVGTPSITGNDAAAFSVSGDTCPSTLPAGGSCTIDVSFSPTRSMAHSATLTFPTGTPIGSRSIALAGNAIGPPPAISPVVTPLLARAYVTWPIPSQDGGSALTGFRVMRAGATGDFTEVQHVDAATNSWVDENVQPGSTYRYRVLVENQYGSAPVTDAQTVTLEIPHEELVVSVEDSTTQVADLGSASVGNHDVLRYRTGQDTDLPVVSPDGKWIAYVVYDAQGHAGLWLRAVDGSVAPRVLVDSVDADEYDPAWSPDSTTVAYSSFTAQAVQVRTIGIAPGAVSVAYPGGSDVMQPSYLPDGSGIVGVGQNAAYRISAGGVRTSISGMAPDAWRPTVSPRGDQVAYTTTDTNGVDHLWVIPLAGGTPVDAAQEPWDYLDRPTWAPDGSAVLVTMVTPYGYPDGQALLWRAGTAPERLWVAGGSAVRGLGWHRQDLTAPVITFPGAPARSAAAAKVPVLVVDDTVPVGGLSVSCTVDGKSVGRCASGWSGTLAVGTHTLTVSVADPFGHSSTASYTFVVETTPPVVTTTALPAFALGTSVTFAYRASDTSGVGSYDVRYRRAAWSDSAFQAYVSPTGWLGTTATTRALAVAPGYEYCFSVRARDALGNLSAWSAERCTGIPLDDRSLQRVTGGWTSLSSTSAYHGTITRSVVTGATLSRSGTHVKRLVLVATTCTTCGYVDVFVNGVRLAHVGLVSTTTTWRRVISLPLLSSATSATITLRTSGSHPVLIDGLGIRRT